MKEINMGEEKPIVHGPIHNSQPTRHKMSTGRHHIYAASVKSPYALLVPSPTLPCSLLQRPTSNTQHEGIHQAIPVPRPHLPGPGFIPDHWRHVHWLRSNGANGTAAAPYRVIRTASHRSGPARAEPPRRRAEPRAADSARARACPSPPGLARGRRLMGTSVGLRRQCWPAWAGRAAPALPRAAGVLARCG
jgi:hypothetical protein